MTTRSVGIALIFVGAAIAIGGGEIPLGSADLIRQLELVRKYRLAELEKRKPTVDEQGAHYRYVAYMAGGLICIIGLIMLAISLFTGD